MGVKDITEKKLEDYADVFADIVNVFAFGGEQRVSEYDLADALPRSIYKADGKIREQERDAAKYWKNGQTVFTYIGLENQTKKDSLMPLRVMSYDAANYRDQVQRKDECNSGKTGEKASLPIYPVVTLVLYYGSGSWDSNLTLKECLQVPVSPEIDRLISDYKINVFKLEDLSDEQIKMFKSDFGIVAEFFNQREKLRRKEIENCHYSGRLPRHPEEVYDLISALTKDERYIEAYNELKDDAKEGVKMCEVADMFEQRGINKGIKQGIQQGAQQERDRMIRLVIRMNELGEVTDLAALTKSEDIEEIYKRYGIE